MIKQNAAGFFPYTPATNLLYGLQEALHILLREEGLKNVFARHKRHGEATRRAVSGHSPQCLVTTVARPAAPR